VSPRARRSDDPVDILVATDRHVCATWRSLMILVYKASPTPADLRPRERWLRELVRRFPEGIGVVTLVVKESSGALPNAEVRRESERQIALVDEHVRCGALILEGSGVDFTLLRSLLRGIAMVSGRRFPYQFFDTVAGSAPWLGKHLGADAADVAAAIEEARSAL
jgi:hypothetical protein